MAFEEKFIGRARELAVLEKAANKDSFQLIVVYGRRRVGKTTLLAHFCEGKRALFFTAQEQSDKDNLRDFSSRIATFFGLPQGTDFSSWDSAFEFLANQAQEQPFIFVLDEFPYAAQANSSLPSKLQIAIDHMFKKTGICMILCGSNQGFMESNVLGKKSPLHGRRTAQIKLEPFGYADTARFLEGTSAEDAFRYYACIGGIPYYLSQVDIALSFEENIRELFFSPEGYLFSEPTMLLRQELREPALYNSILRAIAHGANKQSEIADKIGVERSSLSRYLKTLADLGIAERIVPFGENPDTSRKGIYRLKDACYDFWYRFVAPVVPEIESGAGELAARTVTDSALAEYLGHRFERVCAEYVLARALEGALPIAATTVGPWWGSDPVKRAQTDIDLVVANRSEKTCVLCECKYRNEFNETEVVERLKEKCRLLPDYRVASWMVFSKYSVAAATREKYRDDVRFVSLEDIYL